MISYKDYFKGKRVTVLGLGLLGKRLADVQFLSKMGAYVTVTDLKTAKELKTSVAALREYKNITYVFGEHRFEDFENKDFILKGQGTPIDSQYILHAREKGIPIEMDESLFMRLAPEVTLVGVTGTRGKTTTTELIYHILKKAKKWVHLGGNIKGTAALPLLTKVRKGDIVVFELSSWQLQGFGEAKLSPQVSVFTSFMPDHMNYYKNNLDAYFQDKAEIFLHQTKDDTLVISPQLHSLVNGKTTGRVVVAKSEDIPQNWKIKIPGEHNRQNIACAIEAATVLGIKGQVIKKAVESFKGVPGRLEFIRSYRGIHIYNDTCATTPEATVAGLSALAPLAIDSKVILLAGGTDKVLDLAPLVKVLPEYAKEIVLLSGTGTEKLKTLLKKENMLFSEMENLKSLLKQGIKNAHKGDIVLFSPAFASFGMFKNEYDRGDQFVSLVKKLK